MENNSEKYQALRKGFIRNWKGRNYLLKERERNRETERQIERDRDGETRKEGGENTSIEDNALKIIASKLQITVHCLLISI